MVAFSDEAATFQLQMVISPDCAKAGAEPKASASAAQVMHQDANVLRVAMDSGFGSLSAFNKSFRKLAGMSPSDFRRCVTGVR